MVAIKEDHMAAQEYVLSKKLFLSTEKKGSCL